MGEDISGPIESLPPLERIITTKVIHNTVSPVCGSLDSTKSISIEDVGDVDFEPGNLSRFNSTLLDSRRFLVSANRYEHRTYHLAIFNPLDNSVQTFDPIISDSNLRMTKNSSIIRIVKNGTKNFINVRNNFKHTNPGPSGRLEWMFGNYVLFARYADRLLKVLELMDLSSPTPAILWTIKLPNVLFSEILVKCNGSEIVLFYYLRRDGDGFYGFKLLSVSLRTGELLNSMILPSLNDPDSVSMLVTRFFVVLWRLPAFEGLEGRKVFTLIELKRFATVLNLDIRSLSFLQPQVSISITRDEMSFICYNRFNECILLDSGQEKLEVTSNSVSLAHPTWGFG